MATRTGSGSSERDGSGSGSSAGGDRIAGADLSSSSGAVAPPFMRALPPESLQRFRAAFQGLYSTPTTATAGVMLIDELERCYAALDVNGTGRATWLSLIRGICRLRGKGGAESRELGFAEICAVLGEDPTPWPLDERPQPRWPSSDG